MAAAGSAPPPIGGSRAQVNSADARTTRALDAMRRDLAELRADVAGIDQKPDVALPAVSAPLNGDAAAMLVTALLQAQESATRHEARIRVLEKRLVRSRSRNRRLGRERDTLSARMATLEEVIAALHDNLADLRLAQASAAAAHATPLIEPLALRGQAGGRPGDGASQP